MIDGSDTYADVDFDLSDHPSPVSGGDDGGSLGEGVGRLTYTVEMPSGVMGAVFVTVTSFPSVCRLVVTAPSDSGGVLTGTLIEWSGVPLPCPTSPTATPVEMPEGDYFLEARLFEGEGGEGAIPTYCAWESIAFTGDTSIEFTLEDCE